MIWLWFNLMCIV